MNKATKPHKPDKKKTDPKKSENPLYGMGFDEALRKILKHNKPKKSK